MPVVTAGRFRSPGEEVPFPFGRENVTMWHCARTAIWQGVRRLGLAEGDRVLAPAYSCGSEVDALLGAGLTVDFYRILPDLRVDLDHVRELCRTPARALYVTHYFGFPQSMAEITSFAREHDLFVLEDNAHGLYSLDADGKPLGSFGDIGVFSFPKTLPVPDGGALVIRGARGNPSTADSESPAFRPVAGRIKFLLGQSLAARFPGGKEASRDPDDRPSDPDPVAQRRILRRILFDPKRVRWRMSAVTRFLVDRAAHAQIRDRRRRHWTALAGTVRGEREAVPLFRDLPNGCCPLFYPIRSSESCRLQRHLLDRGVESKRIWSFAHPAMPEGGFPFEEELRRSVIALPIHQDLEDRDMERISDAIDAFRSRP
jgi:dTDP-4-amino-4,6-dideoxygalactose transaminase